MWLKYIAIALSLAIFTIACEDTDNRTENTNTATNNGTNINPNSLYGADSITNNGTDSIVWEAETFELEGVGIEDCRLDDQMILRSNGTYQYNGGDELCGGDDNTQYKNGNFEMNEAGTSIIFDKGTDLEFTASISSLSSGQLSLSGTWSGLTIEGTYKAQ